MDGELDAGFASGSTDDLAHRIAAERRRCWRLRLPRRRRCSFTVLLVRRAETLPVTGGSTHLPASME